MTIGTRVLKKQVYQRRTGVPLYSANVRKVFGFVEKTVHGHLDKGGVLWSIDSDFDARGVSKGESYEITDHCGQLTLLVDNIDPDYLAQQIKQAGLDMGLGRDYRASLTIMADLQVDLPVDSKGNFDLELMRQWTSFQEELDQRAGKLAKLLG